MKTGAGLLGLLALLAALAYWQRDALTARLRAAGVALPALPSQPPAVPGTGRGATQPRKCLGGDGSVVYTDGRCPAGHREQPLTGGSLSVLPATRAAAPAPASAASARPLLRQLAPDADGPTIKERMADRMP